MGEREELTGSDVVPIRVVRSQFLKGSGLHGINPVGDLSRKSINTHPSHAQKKTQNSPRAYRIASSDRHKR
jgi:hypothetical protein